MIIEQPPVAPKTPKPPKPPKASKPAKGPQPPKAPKPPRGGSKDGLPRPPKPPKGIPRAPTSMPRPPRPPLTQGQRLARGSLIMLAIVAAAFILNVTVFSHLRYAVQQQQLRDTFTEQLAAGTAPVSEGNFDNVLLRDGEPVARIEIPAIGVDAIVVEGTSSGTLTEGPGHRRDTCLPGQAGASVLMGRAAAYGGPFRRIQELVPGETISVVTGQGEHIYEVIRVRYAGDAAPPPLTAGEGRLVLETARGTPFMPTGVVRVDARLVSETQPVGTRDTTRRSLPPEDVELAGDATTAWALVFALQFLLLAEGAGAYSLHALGGARTWVVFTPVLVLGAILVADQVVRLLPNLM